MADPNIAIALTLQHEGGYVDDPADPGGATNMGVTQADMPGVNMRDLTPAQAIAYYEENYWKPLYSQISDQLVANKLFDMGVLDGVGTAVRILQQAIPITPADGGFGPNTLAAVNAADSGLLQRFKNGLLAREEQVAAAHPAEEKFLDGWKTRVNS